MLSVRRIRARPFSALGLKQHPLTDGKIGPIARLVFSLTCMCAKVLTAEGEAEMGSQVGLLNNLIQGIVG